jgi:hypothetical protein
MTGLIYACRAWPESFVTIISTIQSAIRRYVIFSGVIFPEVPFDVDMYELLSWTLDVHV